MKILNFIILSILITFSFFCGVDTTGTSSDVDVEVASLKGSVLSVDETPIEGALISLYLEDDTIPLDSDLSSSSGEYLFDSVANGDYKITASFDDSIYGILQDIEVNTYDDTVLELDTLWLVQPGVIVGSLSNYDGNGVVWVYIPGTSFIATVDSVGDFIMSGVAPDSNYTVKFERYGYSSVAVSGITVTSGDTTYLEPQSLTPNMYPQNLSASYDSTNNTVVLTWDKMLRDDIDGYIIGRKYYNLSASLPMDVNNVLINDTIFVDSLHDTLFSKSDTVSLQYQVQGQTKVFGERTGYSLPVIITAVINRDSSDYQSIIPTAPISGDTLIGIESYEITWNYTGKIDTVEVYLTLDGGQYWNPISGKIANNGIFKWPQVENAQSSSCQLKIVNSGDHSVLGISEMFSISMIPVDNIFENGDFENGLKGWVPNVHNYDSAVEASMEVDSGVLNVSVSACDEAWKVRIYQYLETPLYSMYEYELKFRAKASSPRLINMSLNTISGTYEHFGEVNASIGTEWAEHRYPFNPNNDAFGNNVVLAFSFGQALGEVSIDDIVLNIVGVK